MLNQLQLKNTGFVGGKERERERKGERKKAEVRKRRKREGSFRGWSEKQKREKKGQNMETM